MYNRCRSVRASEPTLVTDDALTARLNGDCGEPAADSANHLTERELPRRRVEVPRSHHEPDSDNVDQDARDPDPFVALRDFGEVTGDDGRDAGGKDVGLAGRGVRVSVVP